MIELEDTYLLSLAQQTLVIGIFLGGFSATMLATLIVSEFKGKLFNFILIGLTISSLSFLISVLTDFNIICALTPGYPLGIRHNLINFWRATGAFALLLGMISLISVIGLSGWLKSKKLGMYTTVIGAIALIISFVLIAL